MKNLEWVNSNENLKNPDQIETKSTQIERLEKIIPNASPEQVKKYCSVANNIYNEEFEFKWLDFYGALNSKVENPIV